MTTPEEYMESIFSSVAGGQGSYGLSVEHLKHLDNILDCAESQKGVLAVLMTSIVYKALHPKQDIRLHQTSIPGGYSGRTFDSRHITPYLKGKKFPAMAESGRLTRSLEQKMPYDFSYPGAIRGGTGDLPLKASFLKVIDGIQAENLGEPFLKYLFHGLIQRREAQKIDLMKPRNLSIKSIIKVLDCHFNAKYNSEGASRLPVLAIYAIYQALVRENVRYKGKRLLPLESHTSADSQSGRIGDIDILRDDGTHFEALEIKHNIAINAQMVSDAYGKFGHSKVERYYLLSTAGHSADEDAVSKEVAKIKASHGCQVIVNGVMPSVGYYLRLLSEPATFIDDYAGLLAADRAVKFEHRQAWNRINSEFKD